MLESGIGTNWEDAMSRSDGDRRSAPRALRKLSRTLAVAVLAAPAVLLAAPAAQALPPFTCGAKSGGPTAPGFPIDITAVRVGHHAHYDRFVVQFAGRTVAAYTLTPQRRPVFRVDPSNRRVVLLGHAGLRLVLHEATGQGSYGGPLDFRPRFPQLREARQIGDFEAVTSWGLGLRAPSCTRVFTLHRPSRLVIDVPSS